MLWFTLDEMNRLGVRSWITEFFVANLKIMEADAGFEQKCFAAKHFQICTFVPSHYDCVHVELKWREKIAKQLLFTYLFLFLLCQLLSYVNQKRPTVRADKDVNSCYEICVLDA